MRRYRRPGSPPPSVRSGAIALVPATVGRVGSGDASSGNWPGLDAAQQGVGCDEAMGSTLLGQDPAQRREDGPIRPGGTRSGDLSVQHRDLVSQHQQLGVLGCLLAGEQCEPAGELTSSGSAVATS
jgi:hypothetical protein